VKRLCIRVFVGRLRWLFFTDRCPMLHAGPKCRRFDAYCSWDKPEVEIGFQTGANSSFGIDCVHFWTISSAILHRVAENFAYGSELWSVPRLMFLRETVSKYTILKVCKFRILAVFKL